MHPSSCGASISELCSGEASKIAIMLSCLISQCRQAICYHKICVATVLSVVKMQSVSLPYINSTIIDRTSDVTLTKEVTIGELEGGGGGELEGGGDGELEGGGLFGVCTRVDSGSRGSDEAVVCLGDIRGEKDTSLVVRVAGPELPASTSESLCLARAVTIFANLRKRVQERQCVSNPGIVALY